jgi:hypothetical protein
MTDLGVAQLAAAKVDALDHRVHRGHGIGPRSHHGPVVAGPAQNAWIFNYEQRPQLSDQLELVHWQRSAVAVDDPGSIEVVRRKFDAYAITREDPDPEPAHLAGDVTKHHSVHVVELHAEHRVRQGFDYFALEFDFLFFWHQLRILFQNPCWLFPPPEAVLVLGGGLVLGVVAVLSPGCEVLGVGRPVAPPPVPEPVVPVVVVCVVAGGT